jgi:acyl-homoserine-lactone acylase
VGGLSVDRLRTHASLLEIPEMLARHGGRVTPQAVQQQLFGNRNFAAHLVLPDLLAGCGAEGVPAPAREACTVLAAWDRRNNLESRGAHLFREFWRGARTTPRLWRVPVDAARPLSTPEGLNLADAEVAAKVWEALGQAVGRLRAAGLALDAALGQVQRPLITEQAIGLHGGEEIEGVLNNLGNQFAPSVSNRGLLIDYGTSYVQTVTFDDRGPVAQALLTYGQSSNPASPHATDQLRLFSQKLWPVLPFHAEEVARQRLGVPLVLKMQ